MICASDDPNHVTCARTGYCMVNFMWIRVRDAIAGALDSMTLADLVPRMARLGGSGLPIMPTLADPSSTVGIAAPTVTAAD
jgi:DNA-binding IscR family transcriptional regulator